MNIKRQSELFPDLGDDHGHGPVHHQHKQPGQPGYPQARALDKMRRQQVARVRKLGKK
jgi:hypothetical protein